MMDHNVVLGRDVYLAPTSYVAGDVVMGDECTVMHHVTIRGDVGRIRIGRRVNVQDGSVLHNETGVDLEIGDEVGIGHRAVVHCRRVGSRSLIGIGSLVLDRCEIGDDCIIAAGAVLPPRTTVPDGTVMMGVPAKPVRSITDAERGYIREVVARYVELGEMHRDGKYPNVVTG